MISFFWIMVALKINREDREGREDA
ncbi:MAG: hypothetical protein K940chlam3_00267, partial [Chlamydiae bacterium]|nr:hypothetical protein [Chlamydiota bacterium]